jgi:acyl carrier protein
MLAVSDTIGVLRDVLRLGARADRFTAATPLLGSVPELDSMAVVDLLTALEARFDVRVDDDAITADVFETVGSLHAWVLARLAP